MAIDVANADELLTTTRAVRRRLDLNRPVSRELVLECLRVAQYAPTGLNAQNWRWLVIDDPEVRGKIADVYRAAAGDQPREWLREARERGDSDLVRRYGAAQHLVDHMHDVPVHVVPCLEGPPYGRQEGYHASIYPAVWNFQLALRARGLGSVLTTLHLAREAEVAELLDLPTDVKQFALIPVAYTIGTEFKRAERIPPEETVHWNRW
jgi:nitroreductase